MMGAPSSQKATDESLKIATKRTTNSQSEVIELIPITVIRSICIFVFVIICLVCLAIRRSKAEARRLERDAESLEESRAGYMETLNAIDQAIKKGLRPEEVTFIKMISNLEAGFYNIEVDMWNERNEALINRYRLPPRVHLPTDDNSLDS